MLIDNFEKAEQALDKCKTDFKTFYRAAMFCYGTYYYTLAMMNIEPDKTPNLHNINYNICIMWILGWATNVVF